MNSRITIEVDFNNHNEPIIKVVSRHSEDIRDSLIKAFYQKLQGSSWCRIRFEQNYDNPKVPEENFKVIFITPIAEDQLKEQADIMLEQARVREKWQKEGMCGAINL